MVRSKVIILFNSKPARHLYNILGKYVVSDSSTKHTFANMDELFIFKSRKGRGLRDIFPYLPPPTRKKS